MRVISFEPTPSPNVMKLNLESPIADGGKFEFTREQVEFAPEWLRPFLVIDGVKALYATGSFIALERVNSADWRKVLECVPGITGSQLQFESSDQFHNTSDTSNSESLVEQEFIVDVQTISGIPMQVKLRTLDSEFRFPMPDEFVALAIAEGKKMDNLIRDRIWEPRGVRYGIVSELGALIVEEESANARSLLNRHIGHDDQHPVSQSSEYLLNHEQTPDWRDRFAFLSKLKVVPENLTLFTQALKDSHPSLRRLAVVYIGELKDPLVYMYLFKALRDPAVSVRRTAGDTLSDLGDSVAIPQMIEALRDSHKLVRWRAARYLYEVGDDTAVPALQQVLQDAEFEVSLQARMAIDRISQGIEAGGTMWQQISKSSKNVQ